MVKSESLLALKYTVGPKVSNINRALAAFSPFRGSPTVITFLQATPSRSAISFSRSILRNFTSASSPRYLPVKHPSSTSTSRQIT